MRRARSNESGGELVHVGFADGDGAGIDEALDHRGVRGWGEGELGAGGGGGRAGEIDIVFDGEDPAVERLRFRPGGLQRARALERGIPIDERDPDRWQRAGCDAVEHLRYAFGGRGV